MVLGSMEITTFKITPPWNHDLNTSMEPILKVLWRGIRFHGGVKIMVPWRCYFKGFMEGRYE